MCSTWLESAIEIPLQACADTCPSPMEQHTLVSLADHQCLADLRRGAPDHVAQCDHESLCLRQLGDRTIDEIECLACEQPRLWQRPPVGWERPPPAGIRLAGATESLRLDRRLVVAKFERGERKRTGLTDRVLARDVGDDLQNPGAQCRASLESGQSLDDAEPRLLHDLLADAEARHKRGVAVSNVQATGGHDHRPRLPLADPPV